MLFGLVLDTVAAVYIKYALLEIKDPHNALDVYFEHTLILNNYIL